MTAHGQASHMSGTLQLTSRCCVICPVDADTDAWNPDTVDPQFQQQATTTAYIPAHVKLETYNYHPTKTGNSHHSSLPVLTPKVTALASWSMDDAARASALICKGRLPLFGLADAVESTNCFFLLAAHPRRGPEAANDIACFCCKQQRSCCPPGRSLTVS